MTSVSVIIPNFNQDSFLSMAIDSALAQTRPPREVIVVHDGSTDGSQDVALHYGNGIRSISQPNQGVAGARNNGAAQATGDVLAFLDADDAWLPEKLQRQMAALEGRPGVGLVHCGVQEVDADGRATSTRDRGLEGDVFVELLLLEDFILGGGSAAIIPRDVFRRVGGFDRRLSTSADWDLYLRISRWYEVAFAAEVLVRYRQHAGSMHHNVHATERDMLYAFRKVFSDVNDSRLRRQAYGQLHLFLAGAFFSAREPLAFARHSLCATYYTPHRVPGFFRTAYLGRRARTKTTP
jgi:glycosyltransferase involved in cell wall biosynthesis